MDIRSTQLRNLKIMLKKIVLFSCMFISLSFQAMADDFVPLREKMVKEIQIGFSETASQTHISDLSTPVRNALLTTPRHEFVSKKLIKKAYLNRPLSIGYGQTISQPFIVALMTELIDLKPEHVVLEIGTGSGYQAAILAEIVDQVYTIEIIEELGNQAAQVFVDLNYKNIQSRIGDGYYGWEEHAPFDAIIVTAAASHIPPPLVKQLKPGGKMIIPVGSQFMTQFLVLVEKNMKGQIVAQQIVPVRFVPLTGSGTGK